MNEPLERSKVGISSATKNTRSHKKFRQRRAAFFRGSWCFLWLSLWLLWAGLKVSKLVPRLPPGNELHRRLRLPPCLSRKRRKGEAKGGGASKTVRSQAEPGNEEKVTSNSANPFLVQALNTRRPRKWDTEKKNLAFFRHFSVNATTRILVPRLVRGNALSSRLCLVSEIFVANQKAGRACNSLGYQAEPGNQMVGFTEKCRLFQN